MKALDLFSGTCSFSNVAEKFGYDCLTLDNKKKFDANIKDDILKWDYKQYPKGYFHIIWASPPCTEYSIANRKKLEERNIELADKIVKKTLQIIKYFKPKYWFIENPMTGYLKSRPFMEKFV